MKIKKLNKQCFSLVEVIISVSILIYILVAFLVLYSNYFKFYSYQTTEMKLGDSARIAAKELQNSALQANQIIASHDFSGTVYNTDEDTVVLEMPSADNSGNIISETFDYVVFYTTGQNLYKLVEADVLSKRPSGLNELCDAVSNLTFSYNNIDLAQADKIDMDIEMQTISAGRAVSYHLYQEIYLRNL